MATHCNLSRGNYLLCVHMAHWWLLNGHTSLLVMLAGFMPAVHVSLRLKTQLSIDSHKRIPIKGRNKQCREEYYLFLTLE